MTDKAKFLKDCVFKFETGEERCFFKKGDIHDCEFINYTQKKLAS